MVVSFVHFVTSAEFGYILSYDLDVSKEETTKEKNTTMNIVDLIKDEEKMSHMEEAVATGASVATIEAMLELSPGQLKNWLSIGSSTPKPKTPKEKYCRVLFRKYRKWAGEARYLAESAMLGKRPAEWLEKNSSSKLVAPEDNSPSPGLIKGQPGNAEMPIAQMEAFRAALAALAEANLSVVPTPTPKTIEGTVVDVIPND